jgi:streptogramin lyase
MAKRQQTELEQIERPLMRRISVLAVVLLAIGCSSHSSVPGPTNISPDVFQKNLVGGWQRTVLKDINGQTPYGYGLTADQSGHKMWVVARASADQLTGGSLTKIAMDLKLTTYPLTVTPSAVAMGPDQNLWVAGVDTNSNLIVARVTQSGSETDFSVPQFVAPFILIEQIIVGPDGLLWFTACYPVGNSGGIGRIDTTGASTFYPGNCATSIASGPDGNIWFGDTASVYTMNTQGALLATYPIGDVEGRGMTVGADGAIYVLTSNVGLSKVTTNGIVTQIAGSVSSPITNGPDGKLWMGSSGHEAHFISYDPIAQTWGPRFKGQQGSNYKQLASGPDGNLWYAPGGKSVETYVLQLMSATPNALTIAVGQQSQVNMTEANYSGQWTAVAKNPAIVSVTPNSQNGMLSVTGVAPGTTVVTVYDTIYNSAQVKVTVQ